MIYPLYSIAPQTKERVRVGYSDPFSGIATFFISQKRFFAELPGFGRDVKVFPKKDIASCGIYRFILWDRREYWIKAEVFSQHAWKYPFKESMKYKATPDNFEPKLVMDMEKWETLKMEQKEVEEIKNKEFSKSIL